MNEEFDAVEQAIWEETYGQYFDEDGDGIYDYDDHDWDDTTDQYIGIFEAGYAAGYEAGTRINIFARIQAFIQRWWVDRRLRRYVSDMDDIPF